jgi:hypothetical protein
MILFLQHNTLVGTAKQNGNNTLPGSTKVSDSDSATPCQVPVNAKRSTRRALFFAKGNNAFD